MMLEPRMLSMRAKVLCGGASLLLVVGGVLMLLTR